MPATQSRHPVPTLVDPPAPSIAHCATNPALVIDPSLVNLTLMTPVADVQLLLDDTEEPSSLASSDGESHDVAPLDDWQLYIYT